MNNDKLMQAYIPTSWWPDCYITDDDMIFTPRFAENGTMTATGREAYDEWRTELVANAEPTPAAPNAPPQ